ncbi:alpha/beta fold hydrolase [Taibaiella koreensis]|uniref:alpha/beta fold hydrolase n=1 Tax=Taibaiella koreensis TaxID=1268548 RepID=UPI000E5A0262|nr:alpha/beta hydrolase [Taibaiella koreensis]
MDTAYENRKVGLRGFDVNVTYRPADNSRGTIVFLHDSLGSAGLWRNFPYQMGMATECAVLLYDRRGYGLADPFATGYRRQTDYMETEAELLVELLEACAIKQPILFGHSDGGTIALLAAAKYPQVFKAVITEGAHIFVEDLTLDGIERAREQFDTTSLKERLEKYHGDKTATLFEAWAGTWLSPEYRDWNIEPCLPQVSCPVLVIQGAEDEYGTLAQVEGIVQQVSGPAERCVVVNAGHSPHKQSEPWLIERCYTFLEQHGCLDVLSES